MKVQEKARSKAAGAKEKHGSRPEDTGRDAQVK